MGVTKRMRKVAEAFIEKSTISETDLAGHRSDTVRGWGAYMVGVQDGLSLSQSVKGVLPFADDNHFGVREWAWLAIRDRIVKEPKEAIEVLTPLTQSPSESIRRFSVEAIRPRGVWARHIKLLKSEPALGLPVLAPLKADPSRYVQDSVANWLNDASKDQPDWVLNLTGRWSREESNEATQYIIKRATRTIKAHKR